MLIDFGSMAAADVKITSRSEALLAQEDAATHSTMPYRAPELLDVPTDAVLDARVDGAFFFNVCGSVCGLMYIGRRDAPLAPPPFAYISKSSNPLKPSTLRAVWALGCLLFAMMFGYSPFECDFPDGAARPRVVECSYLRVIGRVPFPARHPYSPRLVETVGCVLVWGFGRSAGRVVHTRITNTNTYNVATFY